MILSFNTIDNFIQNNITFKLYTIVFPLICRTLYDKKKHIFQFRHTVFSINTLQLVLKYP